MIVLWLLLYAIAWFICACMMLYFDRRWWSEPWSMDHLTPLQALVICLIWPLTIVIMLGAGALWLISAGVNQVVTWLGQKDPDD